MNISPSPDFIFKFAFEDQFPVEKAEQWMRDNYHHCLYYTAVYLSATYCLQKFMAHRRPLDLRIVQFLWDVTMAVLSFCIAIRFFEELLYVLLHLGLRHLFCDPSFLNKTPTTAFWTYVFCAAKILEVCDTIFVILRKKKLTFLHWFHHGSVIIMTWVGTRDLAAPMRLGILVNITIHTMMYTYYAFTSLGFKVPRLLALLITLIQTLQMLCGSLVALILLLFLTFGDTVCALSLRAGLIGMVNYTIHAYLFLNFFNETYLKSKTKAKRAV